MLSDDEIRAVWAAAESIGYPYGSITFSYCCCTGARLNEVARAKWSEVDLSRRLLVVPPERFKTNQQHLIPLSDEAMAILTGLPRWARSDFIFTASGERPVNDFFWAKTKLDAAMPAMSGGSWQFHDLRRTFRTRLAELRVADTVAELALGHARKGIQGVYDRHRYLDEIRAAAKSWADRLRAILADSGPTVRLVEAKFRA